MSYIKPPNLHCVFIELLGQLSQFLLRFRLVGKLFQPIQLFNIGNWIGLLLYQLQNLESAQACYQQRVMRLWPVAANHLNSQCCCANPESREKI